MKYQSKFPITQNQINNIQSLIKEAGWNENQQKKVYSSYFYYESSSAEYASSVIKRLLNERKKSQSKIKLKERQPYITISDIAAFTFCPVSYSIKETYDILNIDPSIEEGLEKHNAHLVYNFVKKVKIQKHQFQNKKSYKENREFYKDIFNSDLIVYGSDNKQKPFLNEKKTLCGLPDYI